MDSTSPTGEAKNCTCQETSRIPGYQVVIQCAPDCPVHKVRSRCDECGEEDCDHDAMHTPTIAPDSIIKFVASPSTGEAQPVAWRWRLPGLRWHCGPNKPVVFVPAEDEWEVQPLYAALPDQHGDRKALLQPDEILLALNAIGNVLGAVVSAHKAHIGLSGDCYTPQIRGTHANAACKALKLLREYFADQHGAGDPGEPTEEMVERAYEAWQEWIKAGRGTGFESVKVALRAALTTKRGATHD